jgi:hypothetical protein
MPVSIEPPPPSAEQLADWQALIERIRQGDRSQLLAWDEAEAVGTAAAYQVLITQLIHQRLRDASPLLVGSVAGIIAVLRVDPTEASMIFRRRRLGDAGWTVSFGRAQGLLTYPGSAVRSHMELAGRGFSLVRDSRDAAGGAADPKL